MRAHAHTYTRPHTPTHAYTHHVAGYEQPVTIPNSQHGVAQTITEQCDTSGERTSEAVVAGCAGMSKYATVD